MAAVTNFFSRWRSMICTRNFRRSAYCAAPEPFDGASLIFGEASDRRAKHLARQNSRFRSQLRRCQPLMLLAHQAVGQHVIEGFAAVQRPAARHALPQLGQEANQPHQPELEVGQRHPDGAGAQLVQHGDRQPEDGVVGFAVG